MRGLSISTDATRKRNDDASPDSSRQFLLYSPMGEKGLVKASADGGVEHGYVAPYWAVMLTDRDNQGIVNMHPYVETFQ